MAEPYVTMLWTSLAVATMGAISHFAATRVNWQLIVIFRALLGFVFALGLARLFAVRLVIIKPATLWLRSFSGSIGLLFSFYALTHLPISNALTLLNTFPIWVTLFSWPISGKRPSGMTWIIVMVGVGGILLIQHPSIHHNGIAAFTALGAAVCTALSMLGLNRLKNVDARAVVVHFSGTSTVFAIAYYWLTGPEFLPEALSTPLTLLLLVSIGLIGTASQIGMTNAFAKGIATRVSVVGLAQVVFATIYDFVLWKRRFDSVTLLGMLMVIAPTGWLLITAGHQRRSDV